MKPNLFVSLLAPVLLAAAPAVAESSAEPGAIPFLVQAPIIALPNAEAAEFAKSVDLSRKPAEALASLQKLIAEKKATAIANPSITTRSGQGAISESGKHSLRVDGTVSFDAKSVNIEFELKDSGHQVNKRFMMAIPSVHYLGSITCPMDPTMTEYLFIRVTR